MPKSLLEQLPEIVAKGKQEAERILESLEGRHRVGLQTREWVLPSKDAGAQADSDVLAFCKISETRHDFARLRYVKEDGLPAFYSPDFLVRTETSVYVVETKAQQQTTHPNVQRKLKAAAAWCERINGLTPEQRDNRDWRYVLLGEASLYDWQSKGGRLADLLDFARVRPIGSIAAQQALI